MIICHSKKFIFLHGRKTAGSSIGISLTRYLASGDIARGYITGGIENGLYPPDWQKSVFCLRPIDLFTTAPRISAYRRFLKRGYGISSTHMTANQIKEYVGNAVWSEYFKFTFERNPFDRIASFYFWRIKELKVKPSFGQFIDAVFVNDSRFLNKYNLSGYSNLSFYLIDKELAVDFVGQYDNLTNDLKYVYKRIGIKFDGWLPKNKSGIRAKAISYADIANKEITDKMKTIFAKEISLFDYKVPGH